MPFLLGKAGLKEINSIISLISNLTPRILSINRSFLMLLRNATVPQWHNLCVPPSQHGDSGSRRLIYFPFAYVLCSAASPAESPYREVGCRHRKPYLPSGRRFRIPAFLIPTRTFPSHQLLSESAKSAFIIFVPCALAFLRRRDFWNLVERALLEQP